MFLFFKQKTAYEMRISDWSSDVCSSDLNGVGHRIAVEADSSARVVIRRNRKCDIAWIGVGVEHRDHRNAKRVGFLDRQLFLVDRSEEHTSELQSLMRISYAVFCLKKKNKKHRHTSPTTTTLNTSHNKSSSYHTYDHYNTHTTYQH